MRRIIISIALLFLAASATAEDLVVLRLSPDKTIAVGLDSGNVRVLGVFDSITIIDPTPTPPTPTDSGQLICLRPWSCTLDESDADLTIRESIDAAGSTIPYISVLPGTLDERMQPHKAIEAYRKLVPDQSRPWVFHVAKTATQPILVHQGPLDADKILGWINVPKVNYAELADAALPNEEQWLDIDFQKVAPDLCGALAPRGLMTQQNISTLPGFTPIPKSEWGKWTARFPISRLVKSIRHVTDQSMGSCVGHACGNGVERGEYTQAGDRYFRKISMMSMYKRIGRSPNSGAYVGDAADEIFERGILPANGETDVLGVPYKHTHQVSGGWSTSLPSGWEETANRWKAVAYSVTDEGSLFRVVMDCRLNEQIGRNGHSVNIYGVTESNRFAYENSWGNWGDYGCTGYDSRMYDGYVYHPVLRDEVEILLTNAKGN